MDLLGAMLFVVLFAILLHLVKLVDRSRQVITISRTSLAVLQDKKLSDDDKEKAIQRNALRMFRLLFILLAGTLCALLVPLALLALLDFTGWFSLDGVLAMLLRRDVIIGGAFVGLAAYSASVKWLKPKTDNDKGSAK